MIRLLIALCLALLVAIPAFAAPGEPRFIQGTVEWPAALSGEPVIIVRGDDGRVYSADVASARRQGAELVKVGGRVALLVLEGTRPHEVTAIVIGAGDAAALARALSQGGQTPAAAPVATPAAAAPAPSPAVAVVAPAPAVVPPAPAVAATAPAAAATAPALAATAPAAAATAPAVATPPAATTSPAAATSPAPPTAVAATAPVAAPAAAAPAVTPPAPAPVTPPAATAAAAQPATAAAPPAVTPPAPSAAIVATPPAPVATPTVVVTPPSTPAATPAAAPPPPPVVTPPSAPGKATGPFGDRKQWARVDGKVQSVEGALLVLKSDNGSIVMVDISQLNPNVSQALRRGRLVSVYGYPLEQKFEAAGYIELDPSHPEPPRLRQSR